MGFINFLRSRDFLGHPLSINYKGSETYTTIIGAIISIMI